MTGRGDFWSRRKAAVLEEERRVARAAETADAEAREAVQAERTDEELLAELGLPDPDTLGPGADFRAFMDRAVPERLRRRALRRLWRTDPALANLDGLLDYGEDFTDRAKVLENLQTAYQVGKGMLAHVEEMARQAEAAATDAIATAARDEEPAAAMTDGDEVPAIADDTEAAAGDDVPGDEAAMPEPGDEAVPPPRRRMRFTFGDHAGRGA